MRERKLNLRGLGGLLAAVLCLFSSLSAHAERTMTMGFSCSGVSAICDTNAEGYPPIRPGKFKSFTATVSPDTSSGYTKQLPTNFLKFGIDPTTATGRLKDSAASGYGDREGLRLDSFLIFRSFFQNGMFNTLSSTNSCKSSPATSKLYNWMFFRGRSSQSASLKIYGNQTGSKVAGVVKVDPATAAIFDFGDVGTGQISLNDLALDNTAVSYTQTPSTSCSTNSEKIQTSSSSRPFDTAGTVYWGDNSFVMAGGGANPNYSIGLPQMTIDESYLSSLSGNAFASLGYYQSSRNGFVFKTFTFTPNSTGRSFSISDLSNFEDSSSGTSWGTLTCTEENSPATGFCKGTLTRNSQTGNALCILSSINNQKVMACSAQLPSDKSIPIYFLAALPTKSSVTIESPQMTGTLGQNVCGTFTVRNLSSMRVENFTLPAGATPLGTGAIPAFGTRNFTYCATCSGATSTIELPFYEDDSVSTNASVSFVCNAPVISSSNPSDQTGNLGGTATFLILPTLSTAGSPSIQWQKSIDRGGLWTDLDGETSSSLVLSDLAASDHDNRFRAVLNFSNAKTVTTQSAKLTVSPAVITITGQPTSQTASSGAASFTVAASVTGGSALSYKWQRRSSSAVVFVDLSNESGVSGVTTSTLSLTGRTRATHNGDQYRVVISATGNVVSVTSSAATLTVPASVITIDTHPTNQSASYGNATFTVVASATQGGVLSYQWQKQALGVGDFTNVSNGGSASGATTASLSLSNLTGGSNNGDKYRVVVSGTEGASNVTSNSATLTVNALAVPDAPTGVVGTAGNTQVSLSWTAPGNDGGVVVSDYVVQYSSNSGLSWITFSDGTSSTTSTVVTGLINGTSYIFRVAAVNAVGTGAYSGSSIGVIPRSIPGAPTGVAGTVRDAAISLSWTAPASNGGSSISDYVIQYSSNSGSSWTTFSDGTSTTTSAVVTGLTNGTSYVFQVAAVNAAGQGFYSAVSVAIMPLSSCNDTTWNSAICNRDGYCLNTGGCSCGIYATTLYLKYCNNFDSTSDQYYSNVILSLHYNGADLSTVFKDSSQYNRNITKTGSPLIKTAKSVTGDSSGHFDGASFLQSIYDSSLDLGTGDFTMEAWIYPTSSSNHQRIVGIGNGSLPYSIYSGWQFLLESNMALKLYRFDGTENALQSSSSAIQNVWNHVAVTRQSGTAKFWINGVSAGSASFAHALNGVNTDPLRVGMWYSDLGYTYYNGYMDELRVTKGVARYTSNFTPPFAAAPDAPTSVAGTAGNGQVSLTWTAPAAIGGTVLTDYVVSFSSNGGSDWTVFSDGTSTTTSTTVTGLTNGTSYIFKVAAVNAVGTGSYSANSSSVTPVVSGGGSGDYYGDSQGLAIGTEKVGPSSTTLTLQYANGSSGFKVWMEKGGTRILNATGLIANGWQKTLTRPGTAFDGDLNSASNLCGRTCPTHVFLSHSNMSATNRCVYYDCGNTIQSLDDASSGVEAEDWLTASNTAPTGRGIGNSYYEGNIKTCADKGMRLPTIYETQVDMNACDQAWNCKSYLPTGDNLLSTPIWAGNTNGVPDFSIGGGTYSWTASASTYNTNQYWVWGGTSTYGNGAHFSTYDHSVRCILPSH